VTQLECIRGPLDGLDVKMPQLKWGDTVELPCAARMARYSVGLTGNWSKPGMQPSSPHTRWRCLGD